MVARGLVGQGDHVPEDDNVGIRIRDDVDLLCGLRPDRFPGSEGNRDAVAYVRGRLEGLGLAVETLMFEVPEWVRGAANLRAGELEVLARPAPFSRGAGVHAPIVVVTTAADLAALGDRARGDVLLVLGELAAEQLTPRGYPWYRNEAHEEILAAVEEAAPAAVVAATDQCDMTAALSPFPWIEDPSFEIPSAYVDVADGEALAAAASRGARAELRIYSDRHPSTGEQVVGRLVATSEGPSPRRRALICAHVDGKPDTPAALDNATGVATLLAVAEHLKEGPPKGLTVEFVPFNGEDHATSPGEVAYLAAYPSMDDISLVINIDAAGLLGGHSSLSLYNPDDRLTRAVDAVVERYPDVDRGPEWFASDHAVFAMRGVRAVAVTSTDLARLMHEVDHTPADIPALVDPDLLAVTARALAELVRRVADGA